MNGLRSRLIAGFCNQSRVMGSNSSPPLGNSEPPKQHSLPSDQYVLIQSEIEKLLSKGAIVETNHRPNEFISTLFLVPKKTGDLRPVINLKPLNEFVRKIRFKMESIDFVKHLLHPGDFMITIDLKDAYFSIPIHLQDRKYLRFSWDNLLYEFT